MYNEITRRLFSEKLQALDQERQPTFVLGTPTKRMVQLAERQRRAEREVRVCSQALKRLHARVEGGDLVLTYERDNTLREQWRRQQRQREQAVKSLRTRAQIDLLDMSAKRAKAYILRLQQQLGKI